MCAACWNADERHANKAVEGANSESQSCCWCDQSTTSGIWVRADSETLDCHHCDYADCDELAPIMINQARCCVHHIEWAMGRAFKPLKDAIDG